MEQRDFFLQYLPAEADPQNTARIYFAAHPDEREALLERFARELLDSALSIGTSATVWYRTGQESEQLQSQLSSMQLLVVPVTAALLRERGCCMDVEVAYAKQHNIPILPILLEKALLGQYALPENFGELQFLDPNDSDRTALPYAQKLADSLRTYLVTDEQREQIRQSFSGYIFLSYRKKDRQAAQALMRRIHTNTDYRDIAIWYDEFLTPGENFTQAIRDALKKSNLFALALTPNITEPDNYVVTHEYPMAQQLEKRILPLECVPTDTNRLAQCFAQLPQVTDSNDPQQLLEALEVSLKDVPRREHTAQHSYLLGLAYLHGIDTETDGEKAEELLKEAADLEHPEATLTLANMYRNGQGVPIDLKKAVWRMSNACALWVGLCREDPEKYTVELVRLLMQTAVVYERVEDLRAAEKFSREAMYYCYGGYQDTCQLQYLQQLLLAETFRNGVWVRQNVSENRDVTEEEACKKALEQYQKVERYLEGCKLSREQRKQLGGALSCFYAGIQLLCLQLRDWTQAEQYDKKIRRAGLAVDGVQQLKRKMLEMLQQGVPDPGKYLQGNVELVGQMENILRQTPQAGKKQMLHTLLGMAPMYLQTLPAIIVAVQEGIWGKRHMLSQAKRIVNRTEKLFAPLDIDNVQEDSLQELAEFYGAMAQIYYALNDTAAAKERNECHLTAAQLCFDHYPTEEALRALLVGHSMFDALHPESTDRKERWLKLEAAYEAARREILRSTTLEDLLICIYKNQVSCAEAEGSWEEAQLCRSRLCDKLQSKYKKTGRVADELEYLQAKYQYCCVLEKNKALGIDSSLRLVLRRYAELLNGYRQYGIDANGYRDLAVHYCQGLCLMAQVQLRYGNREEAGLHVKSFLTMPHKYLLDRRLRDSLAQITQIQQALRED